LAEEGKPLHSKSDQGAYFPSQATTNRYQMKVTGEFLFNHLFIQKALFILMQTMKNGLLIAKKKGVFVFQYLQDRNKTSWFICPNIRHDRQLDQTVEVWFNAPCCKSTPLNQPNGPIWFNERPKFNFNRSQEPGNVFCFFLIRVT